MAWHGILTITEYRDTDLMEALAWQRAALKVAKDQRAERWDHTEVLVKAAGGRLRR